MTAIESSADIRDLSLWIDGQEAKSSGDARIDAVNPTTGEVWARLADATADDVDRAVASAKAASVGPWRFSAAMRVQALLNLADLVQEHAPELAQLDVKDNGKIIRESTSQIAFTHQWYRYYAGLADKIHGDAVPSERRSAFNFTVREPLGVIACITAWNSPLLLAAVKLAPALAAGNTVVLKPSEYASASTLEFARLCTRAGMPAGVVNVVTGGGAVAGASLVEHRDVSHVSFTGSEVTGARIAASAGAQLKGVTLELGGKSPNIIFDDADLDAAVVGVLGGIFAAAGQSCVAGSRVLVHRPVYEEVVGRLRKRASEMVVGDPLDPATEMGPIANRAQFEKVEEYVRIGHDSGARLVLGGEPTGTGLYYRPTIFADVDYSSRLAQEEVFGPIMAIIPFDDEDDAVRIANSSKYGLAAGVWTSSVSRAHRMAARIESGTVFVNTYRAMAPNMPVGGYKQSGLGRENGIEAILDFTQVKAVWIETEPSVVDPFKMRF